jgi:hypothetical protein
VIYIIEGILDALSHTKDGRLVVWGVIFVAALIVFAYVLPGVIINTPLPPAP